MKKDFTHVYQLKIILKDSKPLVWRRIHVPENYTFWDLHVAIQDSMGWLDYHLHEFEILEPTTKRKVRLGIPENDFDGEVLPGQDHNISDYFSMGNKKSVYLYDFGDNWEHVLELERILLRDRDTKYPLCIEGERACPPEDVGGVDGYGNFLEIMKDPHHPDYRSMVKWVGDKFDPDHFDVSNIYFDDPDKRWKKMYGAMKKEKNKDDEYNVYLHDAIQGVVENQIREGKPKETQETLKRLMDLGYSRHDAIHKIGEVIVGDIYDVLKHKQEFDEKGFIKKLQALK